MSTILIQTRVDEYTTPELYAELKAIPAGNARTTRLKNLANEALILKRQFGPSGGSQPVDSRHHSGTNSFTHQTSGKTTRDSKAKPPEAASVAPSAPDDETEDQGAPGVPSQAAGAAKSTPAKTPARPAATGARAASRVLSMSTLRGG